MKTNKLIARLLAEPMGVPLLLGEGQGEDGAQRQPEAQARRAVAFSNRPHHQSLVTEYRLLVTSYESLLANYWLLTDYRSHPPRSPTNSTHPQPADAETFYIKASNVSARTTLSRCYLKLVTNLKLNGI
jgi:hypothetical protein